MKVKLIKTFGTEPAPLSIYSCTKCNIEHHIACSLPAKEHLFVVCDSCEPTLFADIKSIEARSPKCGSFVYESQKELEDSIHNWLRPSR